MGSYLEERKLVTDIMHLLRERGATPFKIVGHPLQRPGIPDILACYKGMFIAIEAKSTRGSVRKAQCDAISAIISSGGYAIVARTADDVRALLDACDAAQQSQACRLANAQSHNARTP